MGYAVSPCEGKPKTFAVSNLRDMNYYELTAYTEKSRDEWVEHITKAIEKANANPEELLGGPSLPHSVCPPPPKKREATAPPTVPSASQLQEKRGLLVKKGQERLFVLKSDSLMWFLAKSGEEKVPFPAYRARS